MSQTPAVNLPQAVGSEPKGPGPAGKGGGDFAGRFLDLLFAESEPADSLKRNAGAAGSKDAVPSGESTLATDPGRVGPLPKGVEPVEVRGPKAEGAAKDQRKKTAREVPFETPGAGVQGADRAQLVFGSSLQVPPAFGAARGTRVADPEADSRLEQPGSPAPPPAAQKLSLSQQIMMVPRSGRVPGRTTPQDQVPAGALPQINAEGIQPGTGAGPAPATERLATRLARRLWESDESLVGGGRNPSLSLQAETKQMTGRRLHPRLAVAAPGTPEATEGPPTDKAREGTSIQEKLATALAKLSPTHRTASHQVSSPGASQNNVRESERLPSIPPGDSAGKVKQAPVREDRSESGRSAPRPVLPEDGGSSTGEPGFIAKQAPATKEVSAGEHARRVQEPESVPHAAGAESEIRRGLGVDQVGRTVPAGRLASAPDSGVTASPSSKPAVREHFTPVAGTKPEAGSAHSWQPIANQTFRPSGAQGHAGNGEEGLGRLQPVHEDESGPGRFETLQRARTARAEVRTESSHLEARPVTGEGKALQLGQPDSLAGRPEVTDSASAPSLSGGARTSSPSRPQAASILGESMTQQVFQQLVQRVRLERWPEVEQLTVQLRPEVLGKVVIETRRDRGEALHAVIKVEDPAVKQLFDQRLPELLQKLAESGINVDSAEVDWLGGGDSDAPAGRRNSSGAAKGAGFSKDEESQASDPFTAVAEDGRVSWFA